MGKKYEVQITETVSHSIDLYDDTLTDAQVKLLEKVQQNWPYLTADDKDNIAQLLGQTDYEWRNFPVDSFVEDVQVIEENDD